MPVETEVVKRAIKVLIANQHEARKPHKRIHESALVDNYHRLRALEGGVCNNCQNLILEFRRQDGHIRVGLKCQAGLDPLGLYRQTDLGLDLICPQFIQKSEA